MAVVGSATGSKGGRSIGETPPGQCVSSRVLVSVVMALFNAEEFVAEAIDSVFAQTYEHWELLVVDDGSSDSTTEIALRYARQEPARVRYLEHEGHVNRGVGAARNLGIRHAKGEYIAFLDQDDVWLPQKLQQQVAILESQPDAALVYGPGEMWHSWSGRTEDAHRDVVQEVSFEPNTLIPPRRLLTLFLRNGNDAAPAPSGILVRRQVLERVGGFEEDFTGTNQLFEDQPLYAKVNLLAPIFVVGECWYRYRQHPSSCVAVLTKAGRERPARLFYLNWLARYLSEREREEPEVRQALRTARWSFRHPRSYHLWVRTTSRGAQLRSVVLRRTVRTLPVSLRRRLRAGWPQLAMLADQWG